MRRLGFGLIFVASMLWALIGVVSAELLTKGVSPMEIAYWRALLGGGVFAIHATVAGHWVIESRRDLVLFVILGAMGVGLFFSAYNLAIEAGGISLAVVLLYTAPAFVAIFAMIWLGEALTPLKGLAVLLVMLGVAAVALGGDSPGVHINRASMGWGLLAGLGYAGFYIWGKQLLKLYHPVTVYAFVFPVGALVIWPFADFAHKSAMAWALLAILVVLCTYLAFLLYYLGLRHVEASRAVLIASLEPVIAVILAAILFDERLTGWAIVGGVMVVSASVLGVLESPSSGEKVEK